jgi:hypothetical protein
VACDVLSILNASVDATAVVAAGLSKTTDTLVLIVTIFALYFSVPEPSVVNTNAEPPEVADTWNVLVVALIT